MRAQCRSLGRFNDRTAAALSAVLVRIERIGSSISGRSILQTVSRRAHHMAHDESKIN
jgi:hypothetical protein